MAKERQDRKARLKKFCDRVNIEGASRYVARFAQNYQPRKAENGDGPVTILQEAEIDNESDIKLVLAEGDGFLRVGVEDVESDFTFSRVYFSPLPELGEDTYFLVFDNCKFERGPVRAVAADVGKTFNFSVYNKWYLLKREDFESYEQLIFDGIAELISMGDYSTPGATFDMSVSEIKRSFEPVNKEYSAKGLKERRNLFILD